MIELSDRAKEELNKLVQESPDQGVRIFIQGFG